ncbi:MAG TPA: thiamine pyrophosphate-dependent enzyme [Candidatus Udaeobacter sp.]|nr:thiamine pyrophosphate-dependent enzyme [Candidatus Udaeobacter sp.]
MPYNLLDKKGMADFKKKEKNLLQYSVQSGQYLNIEDLDLASIDGIDVPRLDKLAKIIRGLIFAAVEAGQSGHPGSSSKVEQFLAMTLSGVMAFDPTNPKNPGRDRLIWSSGHCADLLFAGQALYYEVLKRAGRQFGEAVVKAVMPEDLIRFRHADGPQGHAEAQYPYSDFTTGPLGHGFAVAGGMAMVHQSCGLDTKTWVFMGDAESEEGMTYEARNIIATNGLKNLIVSLDYNHFGIDDEIEEVVASPYINHWLGLGWNVIETNGHNVLEMVYAYQLAAQGFANGAPTVVICHTLKAKSYGKTENTAAAHSTLAKHDDYVNIMKKLGFNIAGEPGKVLPDIQTVLAQINPEDEKYILERLEVGAQKIVPESILVEKMKKALRGRPMVDPLAIKRPKVLPPELVFAEGEKVATRKAVQAWMAWYMKQTAFFYAGAGDLAKSVYTNSAEEVYGLISKNNPLGRGIRYGIAEQNMAMMGAGLTQDILPGGYKPVSVFGTFAVFTNMMGNAIRLAVIGNQLNPETKGFFIALAAHDGPETGEDGPTHQGMYWMSLYNALPGIKVYKPTDANETIEMLFGALEKGEPIILSLYRPEQPVIKRAEVPAAIEANNGAYVYKQFSGKGKKTVLAICGMQILLNTLEVLPELEKQGLDIKIIAVTSPELFEDLQKTNPTKAKSILSDEERELVITLHNGWPGFLYPFMLPADYSKKALGINHYLKSGNVAEVYELAGMTSVDIKEKILRALE